MLNERSRSILRAIVQSYIESGAPVGSRLLTRRHGFTLSPATIRNIMVDLEDMGYLSQPHTSAGRVPTDKGYRFYVDALDPGEQADARKLMTLLESRFSSAQEDVNTLLGEITRTLAKVSHYLCFAVPLRAEETTLNRIQMFRYRGDRLAVVLLTNEGLIANKVLESDFGLSQRDLNRISDYVNTEYSGLSIAEIRSCIRRQMSKERALCDILINRATALCREALSFPCGEVIVSGMSEFIGLPEFSGKINEIAQAIEDKRRILDLLESFTESPERVRVLIGRENPDEGMRNLSIIAAQYGQGEKPLGSVGIIGPTRMDYLRAIAMVEAVARFVSGTISQ
ncbi:MAG: heat-inducible transcriptional repressor HrcA [Nitrospirota bacterium]|jgi:heat-inducible transcriptional repressor